MLYVKCKDKFFRSGILVTGSIAGVKNSWVIQARDEESTLELAIRVYHEMDVDWYYVRFMSILRKIGWFKSVVWSDSYAGARAFPPDYMPLRRARVIDLQPISDLKWPELGKETAGTDWTCRFTVKLPSKDSVILPCEGMA